MPSVANRVNAVIRGAGDHAQLHRIRVSSRGRVRRRPEYDAHEARNKQENAARLSRTIEPEILSHKKPKPPNMEGCGSCVRARRVSCLVALLRKYALRYHLSYYARCHGPIYIYTRFGLGSGFGLLSSGLGVGDANSSRSRSG